MRVFWKASNWVRPPHIRKTLEQSVYRSKCECANLGVQMSCEWKLWKTQYGKPIVQLKTGKINKAVQLVHYGNSGGAIGALAPDSARISCSHSFCTVACRYVKRAQRELNGQCMWIMSQKSACLLYTLWIETQREEHLSQYCIYDSYWPFNGATRTYTLMK